MFRKKKNKLRVLMIQPLPQLNKLKLNNNNKKNKKMVRKVIMTQTMRVVKNLNQVFNHKRPRERRTRRRSEFR